MTKDDHNPEPSGPAALPSVEVAKALEAALGTYLAEVYAHLRSRRKSNFSRKVRRLTALDSNEVVRGWFAECEIFESSHVLLSAWNALLDDCGWVFDEKRSRLGTSGLLRTWLRRRGAYSQIAAGDAPSVEKLAARLLEDARKAARRRRVIRIMAVGLRYPYEDPETEVWKPEASFLVGLQFPKGRINLRGVKLWSQPDRRDLEKFFECGSNALFFPDSLTSVDCLDRTPLWLKPKTEPLPRGPWPKQRVYMSKHLAEKPLLGPSRLPLSLEADRPKRYSYLRESGWLPYGLWEEEMLRPLLLWRWVDNARLGGEERSIVPDFFLEWPADPFEPPPAVRLTTGAARYHEVDRELHEADEPCVLSLRLDQAQTSEFREFVAGLSYALGRIRATKWSSWIDTGMLVLAKAAIAEHHVERFLWSIVTLESLLGRDENKIKEKIGQRLHVLCHPWYVDRKVAEVFIRTYDARNRIVHGDQDKPGEQDKPADIGALEIDAFALARGAAIRMIFLLGELSSESKHNLRDREEILKAIRSLHAGQERAADELAAEIGSILRKKPFRWPTF